MCDRYAVEALEQRMLLCAGTGHVSGESLVHKAKGGASRTPPPIRLDLVALHELGHSLGLGHNNDRNSIMYSYYNANYDTANFNSDVAVQELRTLYSAANVNNDSTPWKDSRDGNSGDGKVTVTYSFVKDGAMMEQRRTATTTATFSRVTSDWQAVFATELNRWASASLGKLEFRAVTETGTYAFGATGAVQNDPKFGDIRIAAHKFDGAGKTLAHAYYPPPNGGTAAGDAHFDEAENWVLPATSSGTFFVGGASNSSSALRLAGGTFSNVRVIDQLSDGGDLLAA